jgi:hypothetical protein
VNHRYRNAPHNDHATPGHATDTRRKLGVSPAELRVAIAVISHETVFGHGPTRAELAIFLGAQPKGYQLIAMGWITSKTLGPSSGQTLVRWSSTELARRVLGVCEFAQEERVA